MRRGRPSSLTPEIIEQFLLYFPLCMFVSSAADFIGVPKTTFYRWLRRGRDESDGIYADFWHSYKKALAEGEMRAIAAIVNAARGGPARVRKMRQVDRRGEVTESVKTEYFQPVWQAAAWLLERRFPEQWSRNRQAIRELQQAVRALQQRLTECIETTSASRPVGRT